MIVISLADRSLHDLVRVFACESARGQAKKHLREIGAPDNPAAIRRQTERELAWRMAAIRAKYEL